MNAVIGKTVSRQVLGSMNDFVRMLDSYRGVGTLLEVSLRLAETPCGPLQMNSPRNATLRAFAGDPWVAATSRFVRRTASSSVLNSRMARCEVVLGVW